MMDNGISPLQTSVPHRVWDVAALVHAVADVLAARFAVCTVRGELSGVSRAASGHVYFNLKDSAGDAALVRCAMFRRAASLLAFSPRDGQTVEIRGRLGVYEPRGELQVIVEGMQLEGRGNLYEMFLKLKAQLEAQGLFASERKRPVPTFPRCIGVVTSLGAAALRDVVAALSRRAPQVQVVIYPCLVQGETAPGDIVRALEAVQQHALAQTVIVCRGGGSLEDLWAFNDERVVRAIASCSLPVVCGVGHETDVTLADFAADLRAPTPTAAAELAAPPQAQLLQQLEQGELRLRQRVQWHLDRATQRLDQAALRLTRPTEWLSRARQHCGLLDQRLGFVIQRQLEAQKQRYQRAAESWQQAPQPSLQRVSQRLDVLAARLQALHPHHVLERGFAWVTEESGQPVATVKQLTPGQKVQLVLRDGQAQVQIKSVNENSICP
jgi:exodeoxyribonuclease VII large subunit